MYIVIVQKLNFECFVEISNLKLPEDKIVLFIKYPYVCIMYAYLYVPYLASKPLKLF